MVEIQDLNSKIMRQTFEALNPLLTALLIQLIRLLFAYELCLSTFYSLITFE
jgi:hypothetical protein